MGLDEDNGKNVMNRREGRKPLVLYVEIIFSSFGKNPVSTHLLQDSINTASTPAIRIRPFETYFRHSLAPFHGR